ncbi:phosphatidate cytidylyltransferase [Eubacterium pyruvativorans]|uniref:Phosphatidate cytidylyltransferase n=1 Tax=Eubacterium pyruvativorans TaxID=155865 RepID=A0A1I7HP08_9FIRM|nr:phosphatidate cytidylyltransferase [Eubacterium pyruvativorans]SDE78603.1 phosphatidate cytidylyltransferase [Eubacterium pyruvativorans]SFO29715.1 phosphatidate cytidylyltransferase [Eubacterium pyruvativorans]SFU62465.1 phosphatidate cytidylyltransferase [Eubacterium pyruvativorans]
MKTRIISGFAMAPLILFVYLGGWWLAALCILIGFLGIREFYDGFRAMDIHPSNGIAYAMMFVLYLMNGFWPNQYGLITAWFAAVIMVSSISMFDTKHRTPIDAMATMVGIIYIIFFTFHFVLIDQTGMYSILKWLALLSAFGSDIFAYFTGVFFGKHKMCPNLSPKKTFEGLAGGIIGSAVCCGLFGYFLCREFLWSCVIIGFLGAAISVCGDLTASAYKRKMGIKDYGNLIPGHGGIMDRFDSVLFTAPFVYYYIVVVLQHFGLVF